MDGQYHNPNDYWRERSDGYDDDGRMLKGLLRTAGAVVLFAAVCGLCLAMCGCRTWRTGVSEKEHVEDSVRVEYRERIVQVPVTVTVEVPAERKERQTRDTISELSTSLARSTASIHWQDEWPTLFHSIENIPQQIRKADTVAVTEREKVVWKTRRVTYTRTEVRERRLPWWQKGLMWAGGIAIVIFILFLVSRITWLRR